MLLVFLLSFLGDSIVIVASIKYKALKLNSFLVGIIQQMAVSDIICCLVFPLPQFVSLMENSWVFGRVLCHLTSSLTTITLDVTRILTAIMTTARVMILLFPNSRVTRSLTQRTAHIVGSAIWVAFLPRFFLTINLNKITDRTNFDYRICLCVYHVLATNLKDHAYIPILLSIFIFIPIALFTVTTGIILLHLRQARSSSRQAGGMVRWQGYLTVTLTAVVFCLSNIPQMIYQFGILNTDKDTQNFYHNEFYRFAWASLSVNLFSDFFIYCIAVESFREFIKERLQLIKSLVDAYLGALQEIIPSSSTFSC